MHMFTVQTVANNSVYGPIKAIQVNVNEMSIENSNMNRHCRSLATMYLKHVHCGSYQAERNVCLRIGEYSSSTSPLRDRNNNVFLVKYDF